MGQLQTFHGQWQEPRARVLVARLRLKLGSNKLHVDITHGEEPVGSQRVSWDIAASPSLEILGARSGTCCPTFTRILIRVTLWLCLLCLCVTFVSFGSTFLALVLVRLLVSAFCLGRFLDGGSL